MFIFLKIENEIILSAIVSLLITCCVTLFRIWVIISY